MFIDMVKMSPHLHMPSDAQYPTTAGGDATEFAFHACQWGVPHPPGETPHSGISLDAQQLAADSNIVIHKLKVWA